MNGDLVSIAFPGLGIGEFELNKIAIPFSEGTGIRWYGILITCGIVLAFLYAMWRGKKQEGIIPDDVIDIGIAAVILGIIGARLYYVLTDSKGVYDSFYDVIAIWNGGLAIYGGIIGGCLGIVLMCLIKKISWRKLFDMAAPGVMIAQAIGRWGNFFNGEAYGSRIIDGTTQYYFFNQEHTLNAGEGTLFHALRMELTPNLYSAKIPYAFHPTFLYESIWNILGFVLIHFLYKKKKFDGQVALMYFVWYGFGRMFIEGLRTDSLYLPGTTLRISQCLGLLCFALGTTLLTVLLIRARRMPVLAQGACENAAVAECETNNEKNTLNEATASDEEIETEEQEHGNED